MIFCIDFDGVVVEEVGRAFADTTTPLRFRPGAAAGLARLKAAGHTLVLWSARCNRALLFTPEHDPLVRAGKRRIDLRRWEAERPIHWARYFQMRRFLDLYLPGVFDVVDDGVQGKPLADVYIDNNCRRFGTAPDELDWRAVVDLYGVAPEVRALRERR